MSELEGTICGLRQELEEVLQTRELCVEKLMNPGSTEQTVRLWKGRLECVDQQISAIYDSMEILQSRKGELTSASSNCQLY